ncbi:aldehyde dehydrogenase [Xenorhabdus mauleonii]|uniref:Aldehyde dehydrogenase n=1 Tax=Xenorhabdus mauleonii TaxID=351675 RepID=A0A1I3LRB9_9GAMM|nr:coniferyl aldehyde dehydrogenase [Xenorhabdus mauleonii]PHM45273.1 aldehyde dehydrogenase [Xenorhabdus mauleonii]SFI87080.1 coniferyl-aldehyde dehydrogenase [Xenorhabdus mauleonii]
MTELINIKFDALRQAWEQNRPDENQRRNDLLRLRASFKASLNEMREAISRDFGHRSNHESMLAEAITVLAEIDLCLRHLKKWVKLQRHKAGWQLWPATAEIRYVPLGVIGIMAPWNYPVNLTLSPLIAAIAAGNHVFIKPSEHTPHANAYLEKLLGEVFPENRVCIAQGGADIAAAFSALPFDHLFFTGSEANGKKVMAAAAQNLTPVTLELGGKSPVLIAPDADLKKAVARIVTGKLFNAGQTCIAPDYVLLPESVIEPFVTEVKEQVSQRYPQSGNLSDYTRIINDNQYQRISKLLEDAIRRGHQVIPLMSFDDPQQAREQGVFVPALVLNPDDDSAIMQEEIFGPLLPIKTYRSYDEAINYIARRDRPLAFYCFSKNNEHIEVALSRIIAGSICINDTLYQFACPDLPFGGVGQSGMGSYHGYEGFKTFSKAMPILRKYNPALTDKLRPPYGKLADMIIRFLTR